MKKALSLLLLPFLSNSVSADNQAIIHFEYVNLRSGPSMSTNVVGVLTKNTKVTILEEKNGFFKIKANNKTGWIKKEALKINSLEKPILRENNIKTRYVSSPKLNIREEPSAISKRLYVLKRGEKVEVLGESNGWSKIKYKKILGYVSSSYLSSLKLEVFDLKSMERRESKTIKPSSTTTKNKSYLRTKKESSVFDIPKLDVKKASSDQYHKSFNTINDGVSKRASEEEIERYLDPAIQSIGGSKFQFARLDKFSNDISAQQIDRYINSKCAKNSIFRNKGAVFIEAAKKYNINVLYFLSHSIIETGGGTSTLSRGVSVTENGRTHIVHNLFGIGAIDSDPLKEGAKTAYRYGWTNIDKAIYGAAEWISNNYIHSSKYKQNTLYKMKWNFDCLYHQYASDIRWANAIAKKMFDVINYCG